MKKTEKIILAVLLIVFGVAFLFLKTKFIGVLMTVIGVALIAFGVIDVVNRWIPAAVIKIVSGVLVIVCGWFLVEAVFYVAAALLLVAGILLLYDKLKKRPCHDSMLSAVCDYAVPTVCIAIGILLLFHQTALMNVIYALCGVFTVILGGFLLFCAITQED